MLKYIFYLLFLKKYFLFESNFREILNIYNEYIVREGKVFLVF